MDGIEPLVNVTVVAATNRPDIIVSDHDDFKQSGELTAFFYRMTRYFDQVALIVFFMWVLLTLNHVVISFESKWPR